MYSYLGTVEFSYPKNMLWDVYEQKSPSGKRRFRAYNGEKWMNFGGEGKMAGWVEKSTVRLWRVK